MKKMLAGEGETSVSATNINFDHNTASQNQVEEPTTQSYGYHSKSEMFQRARVVCDDDPLEDGVSFEQRMKRRVKVRYSRGSTYHVRAFNLVPGQYDICGAKLFQAMFLTDTASCTLK